MQYLLTPEEYKNLVPIKKYEDKCKEVEQLCKLVLKTIKFKCIHERTKEDEKIYGHFDYCDDCPLKYFSCGFPKNFSQ